MKRIVISVLPLFLLASFMHAQTVCRTVEYRMQELSRDPNLAKRWQEAESFSPPNYLREYLSGASGSGTGISVIKIPVVVHVLYNSGEQAVSDAQVQSQLIVLNDAFRHRGADTLNTPEIFKPLAADCYIEFVLANIDPRGRATRGIVRKKTSIQFFSIDDRIKYSTQGGDDAWDPDRYLNIWTGNTTSGVVGYSSLPGGPKEKDGIVIRYSAFGTTGVVQAPYNKGHTAVHEIGHWLGLRHIWGDMYCGDDFVQDTPPQRSATIGCPASAVQNCDNSPSGAMYMNYMDLTYDECTNLFTLGQRDRMLSLFAPGGSRYALLSSNGASGIPMPESAELPTDNPAVVFPNPSRGMITVNVGSGSELISQSLILYNQLGQVLYTTIIRNEKMQVSLAAYRDGIYFLRLGDKGKMFKIVKSAE